MSLKSLIKAQVQEVLESETEYEWEPTDSGDADECQGFISIDIPHEFNTPENTVETMMDIVLTQVTKQSQGRINVTDYEVNHKDTLEGMGDEEHFIQFTLTIVRNNDCDNQCWNCHRGLGEDVPIECLVNPEGNDETMCAECWESNETGFRNTGWTHSDDDEREFTRKTCHICEERVSCGNYVYNGRFLCEDCVANHIKCGFCNARGVDKLDDNGYWIHEECA